MMMPVIFVIWKIQDGWLSFQKALFIRLLWVDLCAASDATRFYLWPFLQGKIWGQRSNFDKLLNKSLDIACRGMECITGIGI